MNQKRVKMSYSSDTFRSNVYHGFKKIEPDAFRALIQYYQENESDIRALDFSEYYELFISYCEALFETGAYQKYLNVCDTALTTTIQNNIKFYKGDDIFKILLFRKAAAHYHILEYKEAEHIVRELIKMNPNDDIAIRFLKKCMRRRRPSYLNHIRGFSIFLFLLSAMVICVEILIIRTFFDEHVFKVEAMRTAIFFLASGLLAGAYLFYRWQVNKKVNTFVEKSKETKKKDHQELVA